MIIGTQSVTTFDYISCSYIACAYPIGYAQADTGTQHALKRVTVETFTFRV